MKKPRKFVEEEHENLERWLVSYADFVTLLFAFFVVMYSISSVNAGKYRMLSDALTTAFADPKDLHINKSPNAISNGSVGVQPPEIPLPIKPVVPNSIEEMQAQAQLDDVTKQIERVLAPFVQSDLIAVKRQGNWVEVEMKSGLLFSSGRSDLALESIPMLDRLSDVFKTLPNTIHVEGHTDNVPINTKEFPSNWELSAARAASVVHQLMKSGVDPAKMGAIAYGEYHPLADNSKEEGRYKNRRVVIVLQSQAVARYK